MNRAAALAAAEAIQAASRESVRICNEMLATLAESERRSQEALERLSKTTAESIAKLDALVRS